MAYRCSACAVNVGWRSQAAEQQWVGAREGMNGLTVTMIVVMRAPLRRRCLRRAAWERGSVWGPGLAWLFVAFVAECGRT